jgi:hypothetical protein
MLMIGLASPGCVERRYTIRTDPPGALVIVNKEEVGASPVSKSFTFYGDRDITIIADGYQTMRVQQPLAAPWWDNRVTEFFTENLLPVTLRDEREFTFKLATASVPPTTELINRADSLKSEGQRPPAPRRKGLFGWLGF